MSKITELDGLTDYILPDLCPGVIFQESNVDKISNDIDYSVVFKDYILKNVPFILPVIHNDWNCLMKWITNGKPNFQFLCNKYGSAVVPVANCGIKYFNAQEKENLTLSEFLNYWKNYIDKNYPSDMQSFYLKDWHFTRDFPDENVYIVPNYFSSDWLNEYLTSKEENDITNDDYRFVYMGPKGTWTPFHADVFSSFSWSVNICGKKRWLLFPPGEEKQMKDKFGNLVYDVESDELNNQSLFPQYTDTIRSYELLQGPGEAVFVPSGWHHQVWNLDDTISINHNWINGCNIKTMWDSLKLNHSLVKKEIADCQTMSGWLDHCQVMLKASFGINFKEFYKFLEFISLRRISLINNNNNIIVYGGWKLGPTHATFDLVKIKEVVNDMFSCEDVMLLDYFKDKADYVKYLTEQIDEIVLIDS